MKKLITLLLAFTALNATAQNKVDSTRKILLAEASCGQCQLGLKGKDCSLAVRLNGKAYYVDGTDIDAHGDAHAKDGFCNKIRIANVQGKVVNGRFKASYFELLPLTEKVKAPGSLHLICGEY